MSFNILLLETIADEADQILRQSGNIFLAEAPDKGGVIASQHNIHAIVTRGKGKVNRELIQSCQGLKVIGRCGVGLDNVDVETATHLNIPVINAPGMNASTVAEHAISLMLMLMRNMYRYAEEVKKGNWQARSELQSDELNGKTLGILGLGNIGKLVARLGVVFGMRVIYWDKFSEVSAFEQADFEEVLQTSDIISIHLPLLPDTQNLINAERLAMMQDHTILINTARGKIIDQKALYEALAKGKLGGFGADVLATSPPRKEEPLLALPNVIVTPHAASLTTTTYREICVSTINNILAVLKGEQPDPTCVFNKK